MFTEKEITILQKYNDSIKNKAEQLLNESNFNIFVDNYEIKRINNTYYAVYDDIMLKLINLETFEKLYDKYNV